MGLYQNRYFRVVRSICVFRKVESEHTGYYGAAQVYSPRYEEAKIGRGTEIHYFCPQTFFVGKGDATEGKLHAPLGDWNSHALSESSFFSEKALEGWLAMGDIVEMPREKARKVAYRKAG